MTELDLLKMLSTFGFPAVLTGALWLAYNRLVQQLIEVVRNNTETMAHLTDRIDRLERLERMVADKRRDYGRQDA